MAKHYSGDVKKGSGVSAAWGGSGAKLVILNQEYLDYEALVSQINPGRKLFSEERQRGGEVYDQYITAEALEVIKQACIKFSPSVQPLHRPAAKVMGQIIAYTVAALSAIRHRDPKAGLMLMMAEAYGADFGAVVENVSKTPTSLLNEAILVAAESDGGVIKYLVQHCTPDGQSKVSNSLILAAGLTKTAAAEMLLWTGYPVNDSHYNSEFITSALHEACRDGSVKMVKLLLQYGANVEAIDSDGLTPIHIAAQNLNLGESQVQIIGLLLDRGASLSRHPIQKKTRVANTFDILPTEENSDNGIDKNFLARVEYFKHVDAVLSEILTGRGNNGQKLKLFLDKINDEQSFQDRSIPDEYRLQAIKAALNSSRVEKLTMVKACLEKGDFDSLQLMIAHGLDPHISYPAMEKNVVAGKLTSVFEDLTSMQKTLQEKGDKAWSGEKTKWIRPNLLKIRKTKKKLLNQLP